MSWQGLAQNEQKCQFRAKFGRFLAKTTFRLNVKTAVPNRPNLAQNWHFCSFWARPCRLIWCPVGGLVGGCGAQAVSCKTPIYFICIIKVFTNPCYDCTGTAIPGCQRGFRLALNPTTQRSGGPCPQQQMLVSSFNILNNFSLGSCHISHI